jgi:hypothetical protein
MTKIIMTVVVDDNKLIVQTDFTGLDHATIAILCVKLDVIRERLIEKWKSQNGDS